MAWSLLGGMLGRSALAQNANITGGLGPALVHRAENEKATESPHGAPTPPSAPAVVPGEGETPRLPIELLQGVEIPAISNENLLDKVDSDVEAELKRLETEQGKMPSILFTEPESDLLDQAIHVYESGNFEKPPDPSGSETPDSPEDPLLNVEIVDRNLVLGGISFGDGTNWVIWLNKQRLTPKRLPEEVKYIKVFKDHVDVKWYDKLTNQMVSVRLRPNQRFNLDARIFLPGTTG